AVEANAADNTAQKTTRLNTPPVGQPDVYNIAPIRTLIVRLRRIRKKHVKGTGTGSPSGPRTRSLRGPFQHRRNTLLLNHRDADGDSLTAQLFQGPRHGRLTLNPDGSFVYRPHLSFTGTDTFTYRVFDGFDYSEPVQVIIRIQLSLLEKLL